MIRLETDGGVSVLTLDRPERRNALTPEMLDELIARIGQCAGARAVALVGAGSVFCAGFDLKRCADDPSGETLGALLRGLSRAIAALRGLDAPVVVGVHGGAIAGGAALLGAGDVVLAGRDTTIGYPVVKIGVSPAVSAPFLESSIAGMVRERLLDPDLIDGVRAHEIGLVHELVDEQTDVREIAISMARRLSEKPAGGMSATKRWVDEIHSAQSPLGERAPQRALDASLSIVGCDEERERLGAIWGKGAQG